MLRKIIAYLFIVLITSTALAASTFTLDTVHSTVIFRIKHVGVSYSYGRFNDVTGTVAFDESNPAATSFDLSIKAASIDTGNKMRDQHLRGPDFFDAAKYPTIKFKSTKVEPLDADTLKVTGDLTLHGVTKPLTLTINRFKCIEHPRLKREVCGADASAQFKRSDFGINFGLPAFSPEVKLAIQVEAVKQ